jgi:hypothetical protein
VTAIAVLEPGARVSANGWVEAAPFRAHLTHLMAVGDMSSGMVAALAGLSPRFCDHLLYGRAGRALRRISPDSGRQLLRITTGEARAVRHRMVPAGRTAQQIRQLRTAGWTTPALARVLRVPQAQLADLLDGRISACQQLVALRATEAVSALDAAPRLGLLPSSEAA